MSEREKLFDQFPPVSTSEWIDRIKADLKGTDFSTLTWKTEEGSEVKPFYRQEDIESLHYSDSLPGVFPYTRGTGTRDNSWHIRQDIEVSDYIAANRKALDILMRGVDSLGFVITDPESVSVENFRILLKDIYLEIVEINILCAGKALEILEILQRISMEKGADPLKIKGAIEADPLVRLVRNGSLCIPVESGLDYLADLTRKASVFPLLRTLHLNAGWFGNSGATLVQELALGLSAGNEYLATLSGRGLSSGYAASKIRFSFATGQDYFQEIARLRAARLLWSLIVSRYEPSGETGTGMEIHCSTGRRNKTEEEPWTNMLRTQTEAMSAVLGGINSLTVEPYDATFRKPDGFSERIARNQQLLLREESYFDKVIDPAAGSYYIEFLTGILAENAWKLFLEIEGQGGFLEAFRKGFIGELLGAVVTGTELPELL